MLFDLYTFINIFALEREFGADCKKDLERMWSELERGFGANWKVDVERIEKGIEKRIWSGCDENLARTLKLSNCLQLIVSMVLTNSITLTNSIVLIVLH